MKKYILFLLICSSEYTFAQQIGPLTVEKIMRDPKWMGSSPTNFRWTADSKTLYFNWNPENNAKEALYKISTSNSNPIKAVNQEDEKLLNVNYVYNKDKSLGLVEKSGDIYLQNFKTKKENRLTNTLERESSPVFLSNGDVVYQLGENLFQLDLNTAGTKQITNFVKGKASGKISSKPATEQDGWLKAQQTELFDIIKKRNAETRGGTGRGGRSRFSGQSGDTKALKPLYTDDRFLNNVVISPNGRFVTYKLTAPAQNNHNTVIPNYVTASGYTEDIPGRTKVGENESVSQGFIYDTQRDSVYAIQTATIPGIKDIPDFYKDYPKVLDSLKKKNNDRVVNFFGPLWNENGSAAVMVATSTDNKDRWILNLDASTGKFNLIDRQHDEAWIGGPGISGFFQGSTGWVDNNHFYYQSEATGYSHLYVADISTGAKKQLTSGKWEVQSVQLAEDKRSFYFKANKEHPGITNFFRIGVNGGELVQITTMKGLNDITLSPDEKYLAINYSYLNKPGELYIQPNKIGAKAVKVTESTTKEFNSYKWREPDMVSFKNRYGAEVYARVYKSDHPHPNHPAVVFVHGAGYLQNVHFGWSTYFREFMFNNLLADNGYTVIDIDYTASSGYGRDHRTGIYRHMGGKDLTDQVDGVKFLVENYGVNPKHVGLYGGSYGGFITLMAMFNEPNVFASGAALRSVTDWAHYNHGYTSNILNEPFNDPIAYKQSSPIYFADKLKGNLLMAHGMVDVNVHFQDIVRITQRFIELGKNNWELAVYPVEDHGFIEPSSWTDEYKRIFKLYEDTLKE
ncbi:prolyl oligopeptidase family serine peptidase [Pedobacter sp. MC2016-05]|uniref:S9 family peptidase n=1 Tax=Pedobacter sp. MC2016-05 TaxID=2994474 RepID=UPI0022474517|nr:prolyl oligopeptidase family serine peptidase [Pedobacter sp. MC2016-05]MCX2472935.1 prolyl oligopeptidase family serine peptidase [Pedobacter sp. MC2016-05]